jgi:hypothetical protein
MRASPANKSIISQELQTEVKDRTGLGAPKPVAKTARSQDHDILPLVEDSSRVKFIAPGTENGNGATKTHNSCSGLVFNSFGDKVSSEVETVNLRVLLVGKQPITKKQMLYLNYSR